MKDLLLSMINWSNCTSTKFLESLNEDTLLKTIALTFEGSGPTAYDTLPLFSKT
jgi:hypothetical protein